MSGPNAWHWGYSFALDIANVHSISNDEFTSFNVEPYKKMLAEFGINKPVWVTEAEAIVTDDPAKNATQFKASTKKALELGAEKIFYTSRNFKKAPGGEPGAKQEVDITIDNELNPDDPQSVYKKIFSDS